LGTLRLGKKYIFAPLPTNTAEFKVKTGRKIAQEAKLKHLLLLHLFHSDKTF